MKVEKKTINVHFEDLGGELPTLTKPPEPYEVQAMEQLDIWRQSLDIEPQTPKDMNIAYIIDFELAKDTGKALQTLDAVRTQAQTYKLQGDLNRSDATIKNAFIERLTESLQIERRNLESKGQDTAEKDVMISIQQKALVNSQKALSDGTGVNFSTISSERVPHWYLKQNHHLM